MNEEQKAINEWMKTHPRTCDPTTLHAPADQREYLVNRLHAAFVDGMAAMAGIAANRMADQFRKIINDVR